MKKQLYRAAAATVLGLSLTTGVVAADTGGIDTTGPHSSNSIEHRVRNSTRVENNNDINVNNENRQSGYSGDARVSGNTHGGDARTGDVYNDNSTDVQVDVDNSSSADLVGSSGWNDWGFDGSSIRDTGPHSDNWIDTDIRNTVTVENNNDIDIRNTNNQTGRSGDARVSGNTFGGDAESGDVENFNSSNFEISVTN